MNREPVECFCPDCNTRVTAQWEDWGIGPYEFWGAKAIHHHWVPCCPQCGNPLDVTNCDEPYP